MISFEFKREFLGLLFDILDPLCGIIWKNSRFSGQIWPDWGNTTWADMARLGSIGLNKNDKTVDQN